MKKIYFLGLLSFLITQSANSQNWSSQTSGVTNNLNSINFINDTVGWSFGELGTIVKTTDGGSTWTTQNTSNSFEILGADAISDSLMVIVGKYDPTGDGFALRSEDGGVSWTGDSTSIGERLFAVDMVDSSVGYAMGRKGLMLKTTSGASSWTQLTSGTRDDFTGVSFVSSQIGWVVGESGLIWKTTNGGNSWTSQSSGITDDLNAVHFISANTGWACGENGEILSTTNGGSTWQNRNSTTTNDLFAVYFTDSLNGWLSGISGTLLQSTDGGINWTSQTVSATGDITSLNFPNTNLGWFSATAGDIFKYVNAPPISAQFSSKSATCLGDSTAFMNQSTGNIVSWRWDFGDGDTSNLQHPTHKYNISGIYNITLIVSDSSNQLDSVVKTMNIAPARPVASLLLLNSTSCIEDTLRFLDQSTGRVDSRLWQFGDGTLIDSISSPQHKYNSAGMFDVKLIVVHSAVCIDSATLSIAVNQAQIGVSPATATICSLNDTVTLTATGGISYQWSPPSGLSAISGSVVKASPGINRTYTVSGMDINGCVGLAQSVITIDSTSTAIASFGMNQSKGCDMLQVEYTNTSTSAKTYQWSFEGGTPASSSIENPRIMYDSEGSYDVQLIAFGCSNIDTLLLKDTIQLYEAVTAAYTQSDTILLLNEKDSVNFTNLSHRATSYAWDFGNGTSSTLLNPTARYAAEGLYDIRLIASNAFCRDTAASKIEVKLVDGLRDISSNQVFTVFPNPFVDILEIKRTVGLSEPLELTVFTAEGKLVWNGQIDGGEFIVQTDQWFSGLYFYHIKGEKYQQSGKLIKQ